MSNFPVTEFFNDSTLYTAARFTGDSADIYVHFFNEHEVLTIAEIPFDGSSPVIICKTSDVSAKAQDAVVTISSVAYKVKSIQPEGTGITYMELYR